MTALFHGAATADRAQLGGTGRYGLGHRWGVSLVPAARYWHVVLLGLGLFLALMAPNVGAQPLNGLGTAVGVTTSSPTATAKPGHVIHLTAHLQNHNDDVVWFQSSVDLPAGWRLLLAPDALITLEPHTSDLVIFSVVVPATERTGQYAVQLQLLDERGLEETGLNYTVFVESVSDLSVMLLQAPEVVRNGGYTLTYLVQNKGNATDTIALQATDNFNAKLEVSPASIELAPGERAVVTVDVSGMRESAGTTMRQRRHTVTLSAVSRTNPDTIGRASHATEVVSQKLSAFTAMYPYPMVLRLTSTNLSDGDAFSWQLTGSGALTDTDPGRLYVHFRPSYQFAQYRRTDWYVNVGHQSHTVSPLLRLGTRDSRGIEAGHFGDNVDTMAFASTRNTTAMSYGGRLVWKANAETHIALGAVHDAGGNHTSVSTRATFPLASQWTGDAEYAWTNAKLGAGSLRLQGDYVGDQATGSLSMSMRNRDFLGSNAPASRTWTAMYTPELEGDTVLTTRLQLREGFATDWGSDRRSFGFGASATIRGVSADIHRWTGRYAFDSTSNILTGSGSTRHTIDGWVITSLAGHKTVYQRLSANTASSGGGSREGSYGYSARYGFPAGSGHANVYASVSGASNRDTVFGLGGNFGANVNGASYSVGAEMTDVAASHYRAFGQVAIRDVSGVTLTLGAESRWTGAPRPEWRASAGLSIPFNLPVSKRSDVGAVTGRLVDAAGEGVADVIVDVNGLSVLTDANGHFKFPGVRYGDYHLTLRYDGLSRNAVTQPATPLPVTIVAGETVDVDLMLVEGGAIEGHVIVESPDEDDLARADLIFGAPITQLGGLNVTFTNEEGVTLSAITDMSGRFVRDRLLPGVWRVSLDASVIPNTYKVVPTSEDVVVTAGETMSAQMHLVPAPRQVRFIDDAVVE